MKIAFIAVRGIPMSGGIEAYTEAMARHLTELGHEVTVYASRRYGNQTGMCSHGYFIRTVPSLPFGFAEKMSLVLSASIHQLFCHYDVVHYHAMGPSIFAFMSHISGKATVIQSHGIEYNRVKFSRFARAFLKMAEKASVNQGDVLLVCSGDLQRHFMDTYGKRTCLIYNAVDMPEPVPEDPQVYRKFSVEKQKYYLFLGRLTEEKGLDYLIEAFKKLDTEKKLVIAGPFNQNNDYCMKLEQSARSDGRILFADAVGGSEKAQLLQGAYSFVLPSESEGFSVALLEAMSYGNCCIISDIASNLEACGQCCYCFESQNIEALYHALQRAERCPEETRNLGSLAKQRVRDHFTWEKTLDQTVKMYESAIEHRRLPRKERKKSADF